VKLIKSDCPLKLYHGLGRSLAIGKIYLHYCGGDHLHLYYTRVPEKVKSSTKKEHKNADAPINTAYKRIYQKKYQVIYNDITTNERALMDDLYKDMQNIKECPFKEETNYKLLIS